jgi:hypothetical protein
MSEPGLAVVIACQAGGPALPRCLEALEQQRSDGVAEVIVVGSVEPGLVAELRARFPNVQLLERAEAALVPELWGAGVVHSRQEIVALATAEVIPEAGWARSLLRAYQAGDWAAVGGAIKPGSRLGPADRAVYWLRYSRYAAARPDQEVDDIAGDNGSYRLAQIEPWLEEIRRTGFWEYELNRKLRARGGRLFHASQANVRYLGGERLAVFARQRLSHGRRFGRERVAGRPALVRLAYLLAWPLTPPVLLARIARNAARGGQLASFASSLPALAPLLLCWSFGELLGYLSALASPQSEGVGRSSSS